MDTTLTLFIAFIFSCILTYIIQRNRSTTVVPRLPPSPLRLPIIGNLHQVVNGEHIYETLWKLSQKCGPTMLLHFGSQPYLVISSSEMAVEVLKTNDLAMCTRPRSKTVKRITFNYMDVAFSPHDDHWKDMRKVLVSELLGAKRTRSFKNIMEIELEGLLHSLSLQPSNSTVNLDDSILNLVYDVVCKVSFGRSYREMSFNGKSLKEMVDETSEMLIGSFFDIFPSFAWIDELRGFNRRLDKCFNDIDSFLQMVIDEHLNPNATKKSDAEKDLIDDCISKLTNDEMKAILMNILNGAIETSSRTAIWAMSEIVKNPRIMKKLQNEIRGCVGKKSKVEESDIDKMKYLKMVVKESLRLRVPSSTLILRECVTKCQIGGYDILPGMKVLVNVWAIGRDPRIWKEKPNEFWPERFETLVVEYIGKNCEMIPFGGGRRACPGYNMGISTVEYIIANLLNFFDWDTPVGVNKEDLDMDKVGEFIRRKNPLFLVPITHKLQD